MMDNIEEFHKKYSGTWVRYKSVSGKVVPAHIDAVNLEDHMVHLNCRDFGATLVRYNRELVENTLNLDAPETGFFNHNAHALVLFKTPARQWRRGFCSENHEIYNPFRKILKAGTYRPGFGVATIYSIFDPKYVPNPADAIKQLEGSGHSIALSRHLMLSKSPVADKPFPLVWYNCDPVGFIRGGRFIIDDEIFHQEVEDELTRIGYQHWIS